MKSIVKLMSVLGILAFMACNGLPDRGGQEAITTEGGFEMEWHKRGAGVQAEPGQFIYYTLVATINDSIVFDSRLRPEIPAMELPGSDDPQTQGEPIYDAFRLMVPGDSATIRQRGDQMVIDQFNLGEENTLDWNLYIHKVLDRDEHMEAQMEAQERIRKEMEAVINREEEVAVFSAQVLKDYKSGALSSEVIETSSGLRYVIHSEGTGLQIERGQAARVHYYGMLIEEETMFDNSFRRGQALDLNVGTGMVIQGWDEALLIFPKGTKATVFIPYQLAYGEAGSPPTIPERAGLMFYMEVQK